MSRPILRPYHDADYLSTVGYVVSEKYLKKYLNQGFIYWLLKKLHIYETRFYVLELDQSEILGAIAVRKIFDIKKMQHTNWIYGVEIRKDKHKKGYGSVLMSSTFKVLYLQGGKSVYLKVDMHNVGALSLYRKFNFRIINQIKNTYILMANIENQL
jgi:ribosomal protein S18 acetylase RimI-like enzyme